MALHGFKDGRGTCRSANEQHRVEMARREAQVCHGGVALGERALDEGLDETGTPMMSMGGHGEGSSYRQLSTPRT